MKRYWATLLLLIYSFSVLQFDFLHGFIHQEIEAQLHTPQTEQDICHRSIYHNDDKNNLLPDCHHKTHLNKSQVKCSLCDFHFSREHVAICFPYFSFNKAVSTNYSAFFFLFTLDTPRRGDSRAPPTVA